METWITELTPLSFLERSAEVHPDSVAVVYGPDRWTYRELAERVQPERRECETRSAAGGREDHALGQQLSHEAAAPGA